LRIHTLIFRSFFVRSTLAFAVDERQLMFFSKLQHTDNHILCTLMHLPMVKYEMLGLAAKYGPSGTQGAVSNIRDAVWSCFAQIVQL